MSEERDELRAAIEARRELGPEHEPAIVDAFLERLDRRIAERLDAVPPARSGPPSLALPIVSIVLAVPLTAIAAGTLGLVGVLVVWLGIVLVNVVNARAR